MTSARTRGVAGLLMAVSALVVAGGLSLAPPADAGCNPIPTAVIVGPDTPTATVPVTYDGSASSPGDCTGAAIVSYEWDFGVATASGPSATVTFPSEGGGLVVLRVTNNIGQGQTAITRRGIQILPPPTPTPIPPTPTPVPTPTPTPVPPTPTPVGYATPVAFIAGPTAGLVDQLLSFSASPTDLGGAPSATYQWTFGDGGSATGVAPSHTYSSPGSYVVGVRVTTVDPNGVSRTGSASIPVEIVDEGAGLPVAEPGGPYSGVVDEPVTFDGSASTDDSAIDSYAWDFGDGGTAEGATAEHSFAEAGVYTVTLTVTDDDANEASAGQLASIREVEAPSCFDEALVGSGRVGRIDEAGKKAIGVLPAQRAPQISHGERRRTAATDPATDPFGDFGLGGDALVGDGPDQRSDRRVDLHQTRVGVGRARARVEESAPPRRPACPAMTIWS